MTVKSHLILAATAVFVLTGCIDKEKVTTIGDAENILFTSNGELLVTGGRSIFQIHKRTNDQGTTVYEAESVHDGEECSFTGIAQRNNWVFTVCGKPYIEWQGWTFQAGIDTRLMAANLDAEGDIEFKRLDEDLDDDPLDAIGLPNGLAFTPDGKLLIADSNYLGQGSVGRITLDFSGPEPKVVTFEKDWLGTPYGISTPNGVRVEDNTLYVSDSNTVRRFHMDDEHNVPQIFENTEGMTVSNLPDANKVYQGGITIDDIMPYCGGVALTHFVEGQLVFVAQSGKTYKTNPLSFKGPSSLAIGQGPDFDGNDLLVTEKGLLQDNTSSFGNQLSRVPAGMDLNSSVSCEEIRKL